MLIANMDFGPLTKNMFGQRLMGSPRCISNFFVSLKELLYCLYAWKAEQSMRRDMA